MSGAKPSFKRLRAVQAGAAFALLVAWFVILLARLETLREGYTLSSVKSELANLEQRNRALRFEIAKLSSRERLRALAAKYGMIAPSPAQVVDVP